MSSLTLLLGALAPTATGFVLMAAGQTIWRRNVQAENLLALNAFAVWWYGMGLSILAYTGQSYLAAFGIRDVAIYRTLVVFLAPTLSFALGGLVFYLLYLYTGRTRLIVPVILYYSVYTVFNLLRFTGFPPYELHIYDWSATVSGRPDQPGWLFVAFTLATTVPVLAAYAALYFRTRDRNVRFRIGAVCTAFGIWFGTFLVGFLLTDPTEGSAPVFFQGMGLVAALIVLSAYHPPAWIVRRFLATA